MTPTMNGREVLKKLFEVIEDEAAANPRFMERLLKAFPDGVVAQIEQPTRRSPSIDVLAKVNPVELVESLGRDALVSALNECGSKEQLVSLAKRYRLDVPPKVSNKRATVPVMIEEIASAAIRKSKNARLAGG